MTVIQKKKIKDIELINNGNDVVTTVIIEWTTYDDSDPEELMRRDQKRFNLDTDEVDSSSESFIPFNQLTPEIIFGWLEKRLNSSRIKQMEQRFIDEIDIRANPPAQDEPKIINKGLPW